MYTSKCAPRILVQWSQTSFAPPPKRRARLDYEDGAKRFRSGSGNDQGHFVDRLTPPMRSDHSLGSGGGGGGALTRTAPKNIFARMSAGAGQGTALARKAAAAAAGAVSKAATFGRTRGSRNSDMAADRNGLGVGGSGGRSRKRKNADQACIYSINVQNLGVHSTPEQHSPKLHHLHSPFGMADDTVALTVLLSLSATTYDHAVKHWSMYNIF